MSLALISNSTCLGYGTPVPVSATGGTGPYTITVLPGGCGGTYLSGVYTAPLKPGVDTLQVKDSTNKVAHLKISVGTAMHLLCDIIQKEMSLADGRVYLYNQKIFMPTDEGLFVAVSMMGCKPFGSKSYFDPTTNNEILSSNFYASVQIDLISRGTEALFRKEELIMALRSQYAERQQELNSFHIGKLPTSFNDTSQIDAAAIPYRFSITCGLQYSVKKIEAASYFDDFAELAVVTNE